MNKTDPFKSSLLKKALDIYNLFDNSQENMENLNTVFNKVHDTILIVDCERNKKITQFLSNSITDSHKVIIYNHFSNMTT